jgi:hypothetical protein
VREEQGRIPSTHSFRHVAMARAAVAAGPAKSPEGRRGQTGTGAVPSTDEGEEDIFHGACAAEIVREDARVTGRRCLVRFDENGNTSEGASPETDRCQGVILPAGVRRDRH